MQKIDKPSTTQLHSRVVLGKKHSLVLYTILGAVLLTLNLTLANSIILGVIGLFAYIIPLALWYANLIKDRNLFFLSQEDCELNSVKLNKISIPEPICISNKDRDKRNNKTD